MFSTVDSMLRDLRYAVRALRSMTFVVRAGAASLAPSAIAAIREIDPSQPVADVIRWTPSWRGRRPGRA
jgi:hypothetical protein